MKIGQQIERLWKRLRGKPQDEHEQRLMRLYWNRAELKKELAELQDQRQKMLATLDAHQTAIRRASEQIDELAAYLGRPEVGPQALLYFQLRALWLGCSRSLEQFTTELRNQQDERERRKHAQDVEVERAEQLAEVDERLLNAQSIADSLHAREQLLIRKVAALKWIWHYWRRRDALAEQAQVRAQWEVAAGNVTDLIDERAALAAAPLREFPGLSVEGRRMVNTAAIAYAEFLISLLPHRTLAPLSRHAISVQVFDARLGPSDRCLKQMQIVSVALNRVKQVRETGAHLAVLKEATDKLRGRAAYRSKQDPVPLTESVGDLAIAATEGSDAAGVTALPNKLNILADDYWSITQVLLR